MAGTAARPWSGGEAGPAGEAGFAAADERRSDQRVETWLRAEANGVQVWVTNASGGGMQLRCPALVFGLLQPAVETGELAVVVRDGEEVEIPTRCAVVYLAYYGYDYLLGVRFVQVDDEAYAQYRRHCLREAGEAVGRPA